MAWDPAHKSQTRQKILRSAGELFTLKGFKQVSINDVMTHAGLTRGAFYAHFDNKSELYAEAIVFAAKDAKNQRLGQAQCDQASDTMAKLLQAYISIEHAQKAQSPCPLAFLISDIGISQPQAQASYAKVLRGLIEQLSSSSGQSMQQSMQAAIAMIGGVALARATADSELSQQLIDAALASAKSAINV
ncbi:TetR/AcrR family transcriptional regulator [Motilimonas pumila]|uniref:TetR/AcrR family transcriptional regulator n=1 Tax=Motilimonas pumila TaxID=2303987 RepID=UPI0013144F73|nr:TetR/AcrR family transcriptional regulator [Motilimonas pumila]